jgi:cellulase/cellobiase CelA1
MANNCSVCQRPNTKYSCVNCAVITTTALINAMHTTLYTNTITVDAIEVLIKYCISQETHKKTYSFSKNVHAFFMNMVAEKLWNKNFYAWRFGFDKFSCS